MNDGWIKLHRKLLGNALWKDCTTEQKTILITLLLMANYEQSSWIFNGKKHECKPGQMITSLKSIQENAGKDISTMQIRRCLDKFEKYGFLTSKPTNKNRLITIENWGLYQSDELQPTSKPTSNRQATDKQPTPNKKVRNKECNNNINIYTANSAKNSELVEGETELTCERIWTAYPQKKGKIHAIKAIKTLLKKYSESEILNAIVSYEDDVKAQRNSGFIELQYKNGSTFFRSGIHDYLGGDKHGSGEKNKSHDGKRWGNLYDNDREI